jgi:hypothetical protein
MNRLFALSAVLLTISATAASAQTAYSSPRVYIEAGTAADFDPNAYSETTTATPSLTTTIGAALPHRWTTRFELTIPRWHDAPYSYTCGCAGSQATASGTDSHRITTYDFLVGRDLSLGRRVQFTPLIGFSAVDHADRETETITASLASGNVVTSDSRNHHEFIPSIVWGIDLAVAISPHVAIVPQIRMNAFPQYEGAGTIVRPGVAVRLGF